MGAGSLRLAVAAALLRHTPYTLGTGEVFNKKRKPFAFLCATHLPVRLCSENRARLGPVEVSCVLRWGVAQCEGG